MTDKIETKTWQYYYRNRPGDYGCQPDGFIARDSGLPKREYDLPNELPVWGKTIYSFGWVEYPNRLSFEKIYQYELEPSDPAEFIGYKVWLQVRYDCEPYTSFMRTIQELKDYCGLPEEYDDLNIPYMPCNYAQIKQYLSPVLEQAIEILTMEAENVK